MIDALTLPEGTPIFTWINKDGENTHIASSLLRKVILICPPTPTHAVVDHDFAASFLKLNVISTARIAQLANRYTAEPPEPIILCERKDGNPILVDGHHRYYLAHTYQHSTISAWLVPEYVWSHFVIKNYHSLTRQQLIDLPPTRRSY